MEKERKNSTCRNKDFVFAMINWLVDRPINTSIVDL